MAQIQNERLLLFSAGASSTPVSAGHFAINPVIDLAASAGEDNVLYLWRPNDDMVSKHTERNRKIEAIKWKEDGEFLAAGWSDGVVRLIGLESSKALHHIRVGDGVSAKIDFIAWARNKTGKRAAARQKDTSKLSSQSILVDDGDKSLLDLPHELASLEIETALPKISSLPVAGGSGDDMFVFTTMANLDFVFRPYKGENTEGVHVMVVGTSDGGIHLSMYDSFVIGSFNPLRTAARPHPLPLDLQLCGHGAHPDISTHSLVFRSKEQGKSLYFLPMDLTFVYDSPVDLALLASKTTTLQNLLRYVKQALSHMTGEWKSTRELPARFLFGVREDLEKMPTGPMTIVQALFHTVTTGHVFPPVKDWLVDSVAERGHKRWHKAVVSGLENLRSLVHQNFIPALERCGIILSRLLGLARFHDSHESIGFNAVQIGKLMDIVSCLTMVANKILLVVMDELEQFLAFSGWLRMEIDKLVASSSASEELTEKDVTMNYARVLSYIQRYLLSSPLALYFDEVSKEDQDESLKIAGDGASLFDTLTAQLKKQESGQQYLKALPHVGFLVDYLTGQANEVFGGIAEAEKRGVRFGQLTELSVGQKIWKQAIRVTPKSKAVRSDPHSISYIGMVTESDKTKLYMFRIGLQVINGISDNSSTTVCGIALPEGAAVLDIKFLGGEFLLVLCQKKGDKEPKLVKFACKLLPYSNYVEGSTPNTVEIATEDHQAKYQTYTFQNISGFTPVQMEVAQGSTAKGEVPGRVCLLGRERTAYRTYILPDDRMPARISPVVEDIAMS